MMIQKYLELSQTGQFPKLLLDYLSRQPHLAEYYSEYPVIENFKHVIDRRLSFDSQKRKDLVAVLEQQYAGLPNVPDFSVLLDEKTFTVTTGHQLNIFTGPLYVVYKIVTTINLARLLKLHYPDYNFIPVYWMASEDHDFDEIASVNLFDHTYHWSTFHGGPVGRLSPKGLDTIMERFPENLPIFKRAYSQNETLADAVRQYMHELFGEVGLITIDADHSALKRHFIPVLEDEIKNQSAYPLVNATAEKLQEQGYHTPVNAREINLFYIKDNARERIVKNGDQFEVLRSSLRFTEESILEDLHRTPENYSPNVVLRPLYQETILPNLAYIGGPSEVPYWMELKSVFDHYKESFPILIPRNFALVVPIAEQRRMQKLKLSYDDIFKDAEELRKQVISMFSDNEIELHQEKQSFETIFQEIAQKAIAIDRSMEATVWAEKSRLLKSLERLEKKLQKAEDRKYDVIVGQLQTVLTAFFPNGVPQERYSNFLTFQLKNSYFVAELFQSFDPLDFRFNILEDHL